MTRLHLSKRGLLIDPYTRRVCLQDQWGNDIRMSFNEMMQVKRDIGMGNRTLIEVLPSDEYLVDLAPVRHWWHSSNQLAERLAKHLDRRLREL